MPGPVPYPDPGFNDMDPTGMPTDIPGTSKPVPYPYPGFNDMDPAGLEKLLAPAAAGGAPGNNNAIINQIMQMIMGGGMGGGGGNPMMPGMPDALGMGAGGDPLGMGMAGMFGGMGLNPYQAAGLRLRRNNEMNALRQNMANAHRGVGRFGGRDFSRHVQNIDDEIMALQEQKVQDNIKNALAYNQQLMQYASQNSARNAGMSKAFEQVLGDIFKYGGASPGTFSGGEETQGTS